jgi:hypothetical protein
LGVGAQFRRMDRISGTLFSIIPLCWYPFVRHTNKRYFGILGVNKNLKNPRKIQEKFEFDETYEK